MEGYTVDFCEKIKIQKNRKIDQSTTNVLPRARTVQSYRESIVKGIVKVIILQKKGKPVHGC